MNRKFLTEIAHNIIAGFLLTLGMVPSLGEDTMEIRDYGPHRVYTQQSRVPDGLADTIDPADVLENLTVYLDHHNALPTATKFFPYNVEAYICPCGCGTFLYVSIYHDAEI